MAADFPTTLVTIQRVLPGDRQDAPGKEADLLHNQICDELEALQAKVGVDDSSVAGSIDALLTTAISDVGAVSADLALHSSAENPHPQYLMSDPILPAADVAARPKRLIPVDSVPHKLTCAWGGYAWGRDASDIKRLVRASLTTRVVESGYQFPSGFSINAVFAARNSVLIFVTEDATSKGFLYRATTVSAVSLVHEIGHDGTTHHPYVEILDRGLDAGKIGGADALMLATYNTGSAYGVVAGTAGDLNYIAKSTDDGLTWTKLCTWNVGASKIRHFHAIRYDSWRDAWWLCAGDADAESMICRWNGVAAWPGNYGPSELAGVSGFLVGYGTQRWRTVDLLITEDWIQSFTDTVSTPFGGIWRMRPDLSDSHRVDNSVRGKQHNGWSSVLCADGTQLWIDQCRADTTTNEQRHIGIYGSATGDKFFEIGRIALNGTGVAVLMPGFFQDANGLVWFSSTYIAGKGSYETTVCRLQGKFREERPDNVAPAYFVDFTNGSDANSGKTAALAWKSARTALLSNVVTHGARVVLSAGTSTENGVNAIDHSANAVPAADTARAVQISGQGRSSTTIILSGATDGWRNSDPAKTWNVEITDLTIKQGSATGVVLQDQSTVSGSAGQWTLRDATIGDLSVGCAYGLYLRTSKTKAIRSRIENIQNASKYGLYCSATAEFTGEASILIGARHGQLTGGKVVMKHCSILNFATTGYTINSGATVIPQFFNCVFDGADQTPINNASALTPAATDFYGNYFCKDSSGSVQQPSITIGDATALDATYKPLAGSVLARAGTACGVYWDCAGNPFSNPPSSGAMQA